MITYISFINDRTPPLNVVAYTLLRNWIQGHLTVSWPND